MAKKKSPTSQFSSPGGYKFVDSGKTTAVLDADGRFSLKDEGKTLEIFESWRDFIKSMNDVPTTSNDEVDILTQLEGCGLGKAEQIELENRVFTPVSQVPTEQDPEVQTKKEELKMAKETKKAKAKKPAVAREKKVKELHPCPCGCGTQVEREFAQGHDARVHGWAKKIARGDLNMDTDKFGDGKMKAITRAWMDEHKIKQGVAKAKPAKAVKAKAAKKAAKAAE